MHIELTKLIKTVEAKIAEGVASEKTALVAKRHAIAVKVAGKLEACRRIIEQDAADHAAESKAAAAPETPAK